MLVLQRAAPLMQPWSSRLPQVSSHLCFSLSTQLASNSNANVLQTLHNRRLLQDIFPSDRSRELAKHLESKPRTIYAGIDPTANDLHIGHLSVLNALLHFHKGGHRIVIVIGSATARLGDPTGMIEDRVVLPKQKIESNAKAIRECIDRIRTNFSNQQCSASVSETNSPLKRQELEELRSEDYDSNVGNPAHIDDDSWQVVDNSSWYNHVNVIDFISSRQDRMGQMLKRRFVRERLESTNGLSFREFTYQLFQSNDWLHLYEQYNCTIQLGGSDQLGNVESGYHLIDRFHKSDEQEPELYAIFLPLLKTEQGKKVGKSSGSSTWLSTTRQSVFDFYQVFIRQPDSIVEQLLHQLTFMPLTEIEDAMKKHRGHPERRFAQKKLAQHVTRLVHGEKALELAEQGSKVLYESDLDALTKLNSEQLQLLFDNAGYKYLMFEPGLTLASLALKLGCVKSEKHADDIITNGGFFVNHQKRLNPEEIVVPGLHVLLENNITLIRVGKRNYYIVEWQL